MLHATVDEFVEAVAARLSHRIEELIMGREAKVIDALQAENQSLQSQLTAAQTALATAQANEVNVKDAADIAAENAAATALGLDENGDPIPVVAAPTTAAASPDATMAAAADTAAPAAQ